MNRWVWFFICLAAGALLCLAGLSMPVHLRAVDAAILESAGRNTPSLADSAAHFAQANNPGAASLLEQTARADVSAAAKGASGGGKLPELKTNAYRLNNPRLSSVHPGSDPLAAFVVGSGRRQELLDLLKTSARTDVQALLRFRSRTNTVIFSPSASASGQALDVAIVIGGLLLEDGRLTSGLSQEFKVLAVEAEAGGDSQRFEQALLDLMSLGQRLDWGALTVFVEHIDDSATLGRLAGQIRDNEARLPVMFSAVSLSGNASGVADYLSRFSASGFKDLQSSLRFNTGGVSELLRRGQRLQVSSPGPRFAIDYCLRQRGIALMVKWLCYLAGGFFVAGALSLVQGETNRARSTATRRFGFVRNIWLALGFAVVLLLLSEPFLAQDDQKAQPSFQLRLPSPAGAAGFTAAAAKTSSFMNQNLYTLVFFFVLQALIYAACRMKLTEIRSQPIPLRLKLKLLENEDHLFDAGLYVGFAGTIVSLILVSMGLVKWSLMAAYSSTSFGIIFVSAFKIFNLRPARRQLLLEAELMQPEPSAEVPN